MRKIVKIGQKCEKLSRMGKISMDQSGEVVISMVHKFVKRQPKSGLLWPAPLLPVEHANMRCCGVGARRKEGAGREEGEGCRATSKKVDKKFQNVKETTSRQELRARTKKFSLPKQLPGT